MDNMMITPVDKQAQDEGTWVDYLGVKLKIGRATNPKFRKKLIELQGANSSNLQSEDLREAASAEIMAEAVGCGLLFDWRDHPAGVEYTESNAILLMKQDDDCRAFVLNFANDQANFHKDKVQKTLEKQ